MTHSLKQTMGADGRRILKDTWEQQPACFRFMRRLSYGLVRSMMGMAGDVRENSRAKNERTPLPEE